MPYGIQNRDYYGSAQRGRVDALNQQAAQQQNALGRLELNQFKRMNALGVDPVSIAAENRQQQRQKMDAQRLFSAAQYALASDRPKELIASQFPELAAMNPNFQQETDDSVRTQMQGLLAKYGSQLGTGPGVAEEYTLAPGAARYRGNQLLAERPMNDQEDGFTLSPGQIRYGPDGRPLAAAPDKPTKDQSFDMAAKLRTEFNTQSKEFRGVADSYQRILDSASNPSAAGDLALIFNYMKVLDPGSTVREGEFATAQNSAGIPGRVASLYNSVINGQRLNVDQRKDFVDRAAKLYKGQETRFKNNTTKRYEGLARMYGVDPSTVVVDMNASRQSQGPVQVRSREEAMALPPGTQFITPDGRVKVRP